MLTLLGFCSLLVSSRYFSTHTLLHEAAPPQLTRPTSTTLHTLVALGHELTVSASDSSVAMPWPPASLLVSQVPLLAPRCRLPLLSPTSCLAYRGRSRPSSIVQLLLGYTEGVTQVCCARQEHTRMLMNIWKEYLIHCNFDCGSQAVIIAPSKASLFGVCSRVWRAMHQRDEATLPQGSVPRPDDSFALSSGSHQKLLLLEKQ